MNEIWEQISGYVMPLVTVLLSSGLGAVLVRAMSSGWFRKHDLNTMAASFADKLAGSAIKIDLKAVTEKQLDKIDKGIGKELAEMRDKINMILCYQGDIINCISSSAKLKDEEVNTLLSDLDGIRQAVAPVELKDEITIELKAAEPQDTPGGVKRQEKSLLSFE